MIWQIYAIREIGTTEARYIGQSGKSAEARLGEFVRFARRKIGDRSMSEWIASVDYRVEAVIMATAPDLVTARQFERLAVQMFSNFGHRLFNRDLIAPSLRQPEKRWLEAKAVAA